MQCIIVIHIFWFIASILSVGIGFFMLGITGALLVKNCLKIFSKNVMKKSERYAFKNITIFVDWQSTLKELSKQCAFNLLANANSSAEFCFSTRFFNNNFRIAADLIDLYRPIFLAAYGV